jgi:D-sedoheptulose 7-phosphate isomerase
VCVLERGRRFGPGDFPDRADQAPFAFWHHSLNPGGMFDLRLMKDLSVLTAAGNDYGFEQIFARQIESLVSPNDVLVALTTSGNSPNVVRGVEAGRARGAYLVAFTDESGGALLGKVDLLLNVPSRDPQRIQEAHITIGHIACALIEQLTT